MERKEMEQLRQRLESQRHEALLFLRRLENETRALDVDAAQDSGDQCVVNLSKESLFERSSQRRTVLRLIEAALKRIADGSFGVCVGCGHNISGRRLEALPWTQFCLRCQGELEEADSSLSAPIAAPTVTIWKRAG
jgi:DnaK suppressor protein